MNQLQMGNEGVGPNGGHHVTLLLPDWEEISRQKFDLSETQIGDQGNWSRCPQPTS